MTTEPEETPASSAEESAPEPARRPKLTPKEWGRIEALWEAGETTYEQLVKQYDRSVSTFSRHFAKKGCKKGAARERMKARVEEQMERIELNDAQVIAARIKETKEEHYKMAAALARLTWNEVLQAKKDGKPVSVALNNLKALDTATSILKKVREERWAVLGLDRPDAVDTNSIPELIISELTPEQIKALRDRDHTEADDAETHQEPAGDALEGDIVTEGE